MNFSVFVPVSYVTTTMAGVIYPPVTGAPPSGMMYRPFLIPQQTSVNEENNQFPSNRFFERKRSASQATSVKAEPGSTMAMSESSKKVEYSFSWTRSLIVSNCLTIY